MKWSNIILIEDKIAQKDASNVTKKVIWLEIVQKILNRTTIEEEKEEITIMLEPETEEMKEILTTEKWISTDIIPLLVSNTISPVVEKIMSTMGKTLHQKLPITSTEKKEKSLS